MGDVSGDAARARTRAGSASVAVLVVSFDTREATLACLTAIAASRDVRLQVIVADNGSSDGTADAVAARFPKVKLLRQRENLGFGRAANLAFAAADSDYVLVLNSDCFVDETTIARCVAFLAGQRDAVAVACQLRHPDGSIQRSCRAFPSVTGELLRVAIPFQLARHVPLVGGYYLGGWRHDDNRSVDQPSAAFLLMRRGAWGDGPPFDERFFMYYEDVDLCRRLRQRGSIWFTSETHATHIGEHSTAQAREAMASAMAVSRYLYFLKWHGVLAGRIVAVAAAAASALRALAWNVARIVSTDPTARARAGAHWTAARTSLALLGGTHDG